MFILLISNAVQNAMVGPDTSLLGGLIAAATLFAVNYVLKYILYKFPRLSKAIEGEALMLVYKGVPNEANMRKAEISMDEVMEAIREHGVAEIEEVDLAVLEKDGNISVLSEDFQNRSYKKRKSNRQLTKEQGS